MFYPLGTQYGQAASGATTRFSLLLTWGEIQHFFFKTDTLDQVLYGVKLGSE